MEMYPLILLCPYPLSFSSFFISFLFSLAAVGNLVPFQGRRTFPS
jgi:hypothetical protein